MFNAEIKDCLKFKNIFQIINEIGCLFNMELSDKGILLQSMDRNRQVLIQIFLDKEFFAEIKCSKTLLIMSYISLIFNVIKNLNPDDKIKLYYEEGKYQLQINIYNKSKYFYII